MQKKIQFIERHMVWQEPDCYDDGIRPRWMTSYPKHGKDEIGETLEWKLCAANFPPGTRVTIEIPVCPKCGDPADMMTDDSKDYNEWPNCKCGFSWKEWTINNYS